MQQSVTSTGGAAGSSIRYIYPRHWRKEEAEPTFLIVLHICHTNGESTRQPGFQVFLEPLDMKVWPFFIATFEALESQN